MIDGRPVAAASARVSVFDRSFLYGHGVFETLRAYRGIPFELAAHVDRLFASADAAAVPIAVSSHALVDEVAEAVRAAAIPDAMVRVMASSGVAPLELLPRGGLSPTRVVVVAPLPEFSANLYTRGLSARLVPTMRSGDEAGVVGAKLTNYLPNILALAEARRHGDDDAILVDASRGVLHGASSNVFAVSGGRLITPATTGATLAGITRKNVIALAAPLSLAVEEGRVSTDVLMSASEVFLTASLRELVACVRIDGVPIGAGVPGPVTKCLHRAFRTLVGCPFAEGAA